MFGKNGQLFGWEPSTWAAWDQFGIFWGNVFTVITLIGLIWAGVKHKAVARFFRGLLRNNRFPDVGRRLDELASRWDGLLFTVSNADVPLWVIDQVRPRAVALLGTSESHEAMEIIAHYCKKHDIQVFHHVISDKDDPAESRHAAAGLLAQLGKQGLQRLATDITGGRTPMSVGAFMAAEEAGVASLFVGVEFDRKLRKPQVETAVLRCISKPAN